MRDEFYRENARAGCRLCGGSGKFRATTPKHEIYEMCVCVAKRVRAAERKLNKFADMLNTQEN